MVMYAVYFVLAYLMGNILGGRLLSVVFKEDLVDKGSGNMGARNAGRVFGMQAFFFVAVVDFFKGFLIIILLKVFAVNNIVIFLCMILVVLGHIKPIFFKFKGGKGVATFLGALSAVSINVFLIFVLCVLIIFILTKSLTIGFYSALPFMIFITYLEFKSFVLCLIFTLLVIVLSVFALDDIQKSFDKYFTK